MLSLLQVKKITGRSRDGSAKKLSDKGCMLPMRCTLHIHLFHATMGKGREASVRLGKGSPGTAASSLVPDSVLPGPISIPKCWIRRTGSGNETSTSCPRASRCQGSFGNWTLYVHACRMLSFRYCVCRTLRSTAHLRALPSQGIKFTNLCALGPKFFNSHKFLPIYTSRCSEMEEDSQQWEWCSN